MYLCNMLKLTLQILANKIYKKITTCKPEKVDYWFKVGMKLDEFAMFCDIELE